MNNAKRIEFLNNEIFSLTFLYKNATTEKERKEINDYKAELKKEIATLRPAAPAKKAVKKVIKKTVKTDTNYLAAFGIKG